MAQRGAKSRSGARSRVVDAGSAPVTKADLVALTSALVDRQDFALAYGLSFQDQNTGQFRRDVHESLGYLRKLRPKDYRARYERGGIAERIVEAYPRGTWSGGVNVWEVSDVEEQTEFEKKLEEFVKRLDLWAVMYRADVLAGLGRFAVIVIGAPGKFEEELKKVRKPEDVAYLHPYGEESASVAELEDDSADPRYGKPKFYRIKPVGGTSSLVHHSRVIHVAEGCLENTVYGKPRLRAIWNYLDDLVKIVGGGSEAAWKRQDPGLQLDMDKDMNLSPAAAAALSDEVDEYQHNLRRVIRTKGIKMNVLAAAVQVFGPNATAVLQLTAGTVGIPLRILIGSERGELSSGQDRDNWSDRIGERRQSDGEPRVRTVIDRFVAIGALPTPKQYDVTWPKTEEMNEDGKARVALTMAQANDAQMRADGTIITTNDEIRLAVWGLDPIAEQGDSDAGDTGDGAEPDDEGDDIVDPDDEGDDDVVDPDDDDAGVGSRAAAGRGGRWKAVQRAGDSRRSQVMGVFLALWAAASGKVDARALEAAVHRHNKVAADRIVTLALDQADVALAKELPGVIGAVFTAGAEAEVDGARADGGFLGGATPRAAAPGSDSGFDFAFDAHNPRSVAYAKRRSSKLIQQISSETRKAVRLLVAQGIEEGIPPRALAALVKQQVGLRTDQVKSLMGRMTKGGMSESELRRFARRAHRQRAELIARTETMRSAAAGQRESWVQAQEKRLLPNDQKRVWIVTPDDRLRESHARMAGQVRSIHEPFDRPDGKKIEPGEEPNCRCAQGLATPQDLTKARDQEVMAQGADDYAPTNPDAKDTLERFTDAAGRFTPQRRELHDAIVRSILRDLVKAEQPTVRMLGGGPASGKTTVARVAKMPDNAVSVDVDHVRTLLPEYQSLTKAGDVRAAAFTHEESSFVAKRVVKEAGEFGSNIVVDGTGDGGFEALAKKLEGYRSMGHSVSGTYVTIDTDVAVARALARGQKSGRFVPETVIRQTHKSVSQVLPRAMRDGLFDHVELWDNTGTPPLLVAEATRDTITIHDQAAWERFLAKAEDAS